MQIGEVQKLNNMLLKPISHETPYIQYSGGEALVITMQASNSNVVIGWKLFYYEEEKEKYPIQYSDYLWPESDDSGLWNIKLRFPRAGFYVLTAVILDLTSNASDQEVIHHAWCILMFYHLRRNLCDLTVTKSLKDNCVQMNFCNDKS